MKMKKAPVFYTLGQIRFNPVLNMSEYISRIQTKLRQAYPDFSEDKQTSVQLHLDTANKAPEFRTLAASRWHFKNTERTCGFILMADSLIFHTTAYETSEWFLESFRSGLTNVHDEVGLAYVEGLGVRTLDAVVPAVGESLESFLDPALIGIGSKLSGNIQQSFYELIMDSPHGRLTSRSVLLNGKIGIPSDLAPIPLKLIDRASNTNGPHVVLDNDCAQVGRFNFEIEVIMEKLRQVKEGVTKPFYAAITDEALKAWS